jgi:NAD(P)-dependent dehydrogenase (short-subunit alcohol dehydrogenase family)
MPLLAGKVAIVTGAGNGLGRRYAELFAAEGAAVVVNDLGVSVTGEPDGHVSPSETVAAGILRAGGRAVANHADVSVPESAATLLTDALDHFGRADILVNNAGIVRDRPFVQMSMDEWDSVIAVHLRGTMCATQPVFRYLREAGHGGVIVNTTSRTGIRGKVNEANYGAAKGGIIGFSNVLALEGTEHGIRVWTISPRAATRSWSTVGETSAGPMSQQLLDHFTMDAVAATALYMVSDLSAPHTGKVVFASAESVREVRWESAQRYQPGSATTAEDLARAVARGEALFTEAADPDRIA